MTKPALIFLCVFALYFFTRSPGLDEWDSVQFAMGVQHFDLWQHQPHPLGYPLYIFFGWLGQKHLHWEPEFSLHTASCLGGALFVAAWFMIVRTQFSEAFAWLIAGALAITPIVWMTATKVLSDSLATGLLSAQLLCALLYRQNKRKGDLILTALTGAAAVGVRPQLIAVAIVILITPLWQCRAPWRIWVAGFLALITGCLTWLLPMWYWQWKLRPELAWWEVYPKLIYEQWRWRLDKPWAFVGAGGLSAASLWERFMSHIVGWFRIGLGFSESTPILIVGGILTLAGVASYSVQRPKGDGKFWKSQCWWAGLYVLVVFCFLPWDQRYYLPIFPLLLITLTLGLFQLPGRWNLLALAWPLLLFCISLPLAIANHNEEAPPVRFVRYLQGRHPLDERDNVLLILRECARHVQWYAPEFSMYFDAASLAELRPSLLAQASVIYTDEPDLAVGPNWQLTPVATFERSELISPKQIIVDIYKVEPLPSKPSNQFNRKRPNGN